MSHYNLQNSPQGILNASEQREAVAWAASEDECMEETTDCTDSSNEQKHRSLVDPREAAQDTWTELSGIEDNLQSNGNDNQFSCDDLVTNNQQNVFQPNGVFNLFIRLNVHCMICKSNRSQQRTIIISNLV